MKQSKSVELLAPAGDFEKLKVAFSYGADAVYLAGHSFGLRSAADNFSLNEIEQAISYAHRLQKKVYLAVNTFPNNNEMEEIADYLKVLSQLELDALIIADAGVFSLAKELTHFNIHLSTQASVTNIETVKFWLEQGVSRIVLGREVSIQEARSINEQCDIELEMFIHGSMCMSYSGKCTISNYTANRDANRGGCVNSCRWEYSISDTPEKPSSTKSYTMNSKDLWSINLIPEMITSGMNALKIEGRMKSHFYLSHTVRTYRDIIDTCLENRAVTNENRLKWIQQLNTYPNRGYSEGFLQHRAGKESILYDNAKSKSQSDYLGIVKEVGHDFILLQVKNRFFINDILNFLTFSGRQISFQVKEIVDIARKNISEAKPNSLVFIQKHPSIEPYNVVSTTSILRL